MPIEFEPIQWESKCGRFTISNTGLTQKPFSVADETTIEGTRADTFSAAVAWCESRAKQQQGQGGESNV